ncbi:MAG: glycoside hydrolase family 88 protein [Clostridia bacterium]|nr:glycoside hydrolase family 88 protein [Clostridia bacterium]
MHLQPMEAARLAVETMMRRYEAPLLPPVGRFHYHQGVFLSGVYQTYLLTGDERYFRYMRDWVDSVIDENGRILQFDRGQMDDLQPGILLYPLRARTDDPRYETALGTIGEIFLSYPRNRVGGFWHKSDDRCRDQMWLDGLYMGGPVCAEFGKTFGRPEYFDLVAEQAILMEKHTRDPKTGLLYHAWDAEKRMPWANPETGLSPEFWGRSIGWVGVAILDDLDFIPAEHPKAEEMRNIVRRLMKAIAPYQGADGRWYQVVDKPDGEGNWPENSCTSLFTAALCKGARTGVLEPSVLERAQRGYDGVINSLKMDGDDLLIGDVCIGTGVGDYQHYIHRPTSVNDLHGVGAFLLMCAEAARAGLK